MGLGAVKQLLGAPCEPKFAAKTKPIPLTLDAAPSPRDNLKVSHNRSSCRGSAVNEPDEHP